MQGAKPYIVGLTGGIGSGKSAAALIFAELGATIVDVDSISHALTAANGPAIAAIRMAFGATAINGDGALDRAAMRHMVFADPAARKKLEAILHPMIRSEADRRCQAASRLSYVVLVVPLLIESGDYRQRCDRIVVVDCSEANQIARTTVRSGITDENVKRIMAVQSSRAERLAVADDIIQNDGDLSALRSRVDDLNRKYLVLKDTNTSFS